MLQPLHKRRSPADYQHSQIEHVEHTMLQDSTLKKAEHCKGIGFLCAGATTCSLHDSPLESNGPRASGAVGVSAMVSAAPGRSGSSASKTKSAKRNGSDPKPAAPPAGRFGYLSHSSPDQPFTFHGAGLRVHLPSTCEHRGCNRHRHGQKQ